MPIITLARHAHLISAAHGNRLVIDYRRHLFWKNGEPLKNPNKKYDTPRYGGAFRFIAALLCASPEMVPHKAMAAALWGDDPNGGPLSGEHMFCIWVSRYRALIRLMGFEPVCWFGMAFAFVPLDELHKCKTPRRGGMARGFAATREMDRQQQA